jgi:hypothetical protein
MKQGMPITVRVKRRTIRGRTQLYDETCGRANRTITGEGERETNDYFFFLPFRGLWRCCLLTLDLEVR